MECYFKRKLPPAAASDGSTDERNSGDVAGNSNGYERGSGDMEMLLVMPILMKGQQGLQKEML